jgi:DNA-binding NarL/FixJ family response regulator
MARRLLMAGGYEVIGMAADGADAVHQAALLRPHLVLLDVLLRVQRMRAINRRTVGLMR